MFSLASWSNPETLGLNLMNLILGILTLWLFGRVGWSFLHELIHGHEDLLQEEVPHHRTALFRATSNHWLFRKALKKPRRPLHGAGF